MGIKYMELKDKTVFIISYEEWGDMLMSKHHYAIELSRKGNRVYFINHPDKRRRLKRGEIRILDTSYPNLFSVESRFVHPYFFKFKFRKLYNYLTGIHIRRIISKTGKYPDVAWSFDAGNSLPLKCFPKSKLRLFMPVDGPYYIQEELWAAEKADVIMSVTEQILERYDVLKLPKLRLNHGVAGAFINEVINGQSNSPLRIGYSGSLVREDLDIPVFKNIIEAHRDKIFEFWGENDPNKSTIHLPQDVTSETRDFLSFLKNSSNVVMHGPVKSGVLAEGIKRMDALLVCYDVKNNQSGGTNSHKLLEYLGTGKVVISNNMSTYAKNYPGLIEMVSSRDNNDELPALFSSVINNLQKHNAVTEQEFRRDFAKQFTYSAQIDRIQSFISETFRTVA